MWSIRPNLFKVFSVGVVLLSLGWFLSEYSVSFGTNNREGNLINDPSRWEQPQDKFSQSDDGDGSVTLTARYLPGLSSPSTNHTVFEIFLNTHSVDLSSVDFARDVYLIKAGQVYTAIDTEVEGSGHHRSARMIFPQVDLPFDLIAKNVGGVAKRVLSWDSL